MRLYVYACLLLPLWVWLFLCVSLYCGQFNMSIAEMVNFPHLSLLNNFLGLLLACFCLHFISKPKKKSDLELTKQMVKYIRSNADSFSIARILQEIILG